MQGCNWESSEFTLRDGRTVTLPNRAFQKGSGYVVMVWSFGTPGLTLQVCRGTRGIRLLRYFTCHDDDDDDDDVFLLM